MTAPDTARRTLAVVLALLTLTSSITAGVAFAAGPAAAHGDHTDGGGTDGSNEWAADSKAFQKETVLSGLDRPTETIFLPDGRMLVIQQGGEILIDDPSTRGGAETYLDIGQIDSVESDRERGLIGITLDPNFEQNGHFYVYYSRLDNPGAENEVNSEPENVLARFTHRERDGGTTSRADPDSREVLWRNEIRTGKNIVCCHFGGGLDIGPDGKIYLTTGEEFEGSRAQDLSVPDGKVIRLNRDGSIPEDNPYANDGDPDTLGEIWASGLRNPYRAKFGANGKLYISEVGGNEEPTSQEDIHVGKKGANYGWPKCEGMCDDPDFTDPIYTYSHGESGDPPGAAVTVGPHYTGDMFPDEYDGVLFYGDYNDGWLKYLTLEDGGTKAGTSYNFDDDAGALVSMTQGPDGALYGTNYYSRQSGSGAIVRYVYEGSNTAPSVDSVRATPKTGEVPLNVTFEAEATDPDGDDLTYTWHLGDGTTAQGATVTHTYENAGSYDAYVEVTDGDSTASSDVTTVTAGAAPTVEITSPDDGATFRAGESVATAANVTDPEDGRLTGESVEWAVQLAHNDHIHPTTSGTGDSFTFDVPTTGHPTTGDVGYRITVTATDSDGLQTTKSVEIRPEEVDVTLQTQPGGVPVDVEGSPHSTDGGYTFDTVVGYEHTFSAPTSVCRDGTAYQFDQWSDGSTERTRTYTVPDSAATVTAQYTETGACEGLPESGLVGHYEADSGIQTDGDGVTGWADQSGNDNGLTARGAPQFDASDANGAGAVVFDGEDDLLERSGGLNGFPAGSEDRTMFVVANYTDNDDGFGGVAYGRASRNQAFGLVVDDAGRLTVQGFGGGNDFPSGKQGVGAGWLTQSVVYENGSFTQYADGQALNSGTHQFDTRPRRFAVGGEITPPPYTEMRVSAVLVYDRALTEEERTRVQSYLARKYVGNDTGTENQSPELGNVSVTYTGGEKTVDVVESASDPDGDGLDPSSVRVVEAPANGTATANDDGTVTYATNDENASGDTFRVAVSDAKGAESDPATVRLTYQISETNAPPTANDDAANVTVDQSVTVPVLDNDRDADGSVDASSLAIVSGPSAGSVTANDDGTVTYAHTGDGPTTDSFTYEVADDDGDYGTASVEVTVESAATDAGTPATSDDYATVESGGNVTVDVLANDSSAAVPGSIVINDGGEHGTAAVENGEVTYQHAGESVEDDLIEYTVADGDGNRSKPTFVYVDVTGSTAPEGESGDDGDDGGQTGDDGNDGGQTGDDEENDNDDGSSNQPANPGGGGGGGDDDDDDRPSRHSSPSGSSGESGSVPSADKRASFEVSNATLSTTNATVGESVNASAVVENVGNAAGNATVNLSVSNETVDTRNLSVGAGENATVAFSYTFDEAGTFAVRVDNRSVATVTVTDAAANESDSEGDASDETTETVTDEADESDAGAGTETTDAGATETPTEANAAGGDGTATETDAGTETNTGTPGFGPVVAALSMLLAAAMLALRRRD